MFGKSKPNEGAQYFTVYDSKAQCYVEPFPAPNKDVLIRDFINAFRKPEAVNNNRYYLNAEDFQVFRIASFDFNSGELVPCKAEHVVNLHELRALVDADRPARALLPT